MKRILPLIVLCLMGSGLARPQSIPDASGAEVNVTGGPVLRDYTSLYFYDGSSNVEYVCTGSSTQATSTWSVGAATLTSIVVVSNVATVTFPAAHGLNPKNPITVSGGGTAVFNNLTYKVSTTATATTLTFPVTTADATYTLSSLQITSTAPRTDQPIWKIVTYTYVASKVYSVQSSSFRQICDNRAATGVNTITYK